MTADGYGRAHVDTPAWVTRLVAVGALVVAIGMCWCAWQDAGGFPAVDTRPVEEAGR
jgi:hypothetical protein